MIENNLPVIPFGKYKGKPITDLLRDKSYVEWCKKQNQLKLIDKVYNKRIIEQELEQLYKDKLYRKYFGEEKMIFSPITKIEIESEYNWDVRILVFPYLDIDVKFKKKIYDREGTLMFLNFENYFSRSNSLVWHCGEYDAAISVLSFEICMEIKTILGDDYPCVLRKMKNQMKLTQGNRLIFVLLVKEFNSSVISRDNLKEIFINSGIIVIFTHEIFDDKVSKKLIPTCQNCVKLKKKIRKLEKELLELKQKFNK